MRETRYPHGDEPEDIIGEIAFGFVLVVAIFVLIAMAVVP